MDELSSSIFYFINMDYDKILLNIFFSRTNKEFNGNKFSEYKKRNYPNIQKYLLNRFSDTEGEKASLYRIKYNINKIPTCKTCGAPLKIVFGHEVYRNYCSYKCTNSSKEKLSKCESTCLNKYGVKSAWCQNKKFDTLKRKYGSIYVLQNKNIMNKRYNTLKTNHTFNTSKPEEELYLYIKEKFPSVIRQYKDTRYPFACDFYIPELDYFIELNGTWTHGKHPFNSNSEEDKYLLEKMQTKALSGHKYYFVAIRTWTVTDPLKREIAKQNNLHFKEVWTLDEGKKFIDELGQ